MGAELAGPFSPGGRRAGGPRRRDSARFALVAGLVLAVPLSIATLSAARRRVPPPAERRAFLRARSGRNRL